MKQVVLAVFCVCLTVTLQPIGQTLWESRLEGVIFAHNSGFKARKWKKRSRIGSNEIHYANSSILNGVKGVFHGSR